MVCSALPRSAHAFSLGAQSFYELKEGRVHALVRLLFPQNGKDNKPCITAVAKLYPSICPFRMRCYTPDFDRKTTERSVMLYNLSHTYNLAFTSRWRMNSRKPQDKSFTNGSKASVNITKLPKYMTNMVGPHKA